MALIKKTYIDGETVITADNLNDMQDAIIALEDGLFTVDNQAGGEVITITDAAKRGFRGFNIYGKTTQDGTPTPEAPVELVSAGDSGSITVSVTGEKAAQSMTIATPNGLPGIPVSAGGNYTDTSGQQWVCDEIDFARGVYIQRCCRENVSLVYEATANRYTQQLSHYANVNFAIGNGIIVVCDKLSFNNNASGKANGVVVNGVRGSVNSPKTLVAYYNGQDPGPLNVVYPIAEPIETPLSEEELAAYAALYTYRDNTTVSNDAGAYMDLEYTMDAKKYIDSTIAANSAAPARLSGITLLASAWAGSSGLYSQVVAIEGITEYSKVDLLPSIEQLAVFHEKDLAFVTENEDGVVTVFALGDKPTNNYTMQVSITEVKE